MQAISHPTALGLIAEILCDEADLKRHLALRLADHILDCLSALPNALPILTDSEVRLALAAVERERTK